MTWTYSGDPSSSLLDEVRFLSQMTDPNEQLLSDEEISYIISEETTAQNSAARCCEILSVRYSREADIVAGANGELSIKFSQLSNKFAAMGKDLRAAGSKYASPWAGSISITEKESQEERSDRVEPAFARGQFDGDSVSDNPSVKDWTEYGSA